ncbi:MAG: DUF3597 domain-containing protein [Pseudomonadota bacterium]|nr:DUF3597 domain-containing protein [Pseudomonadota bacterium]
MSIFGTLLSKIFPSSHPAVAAAQNAPAGGAAGNTAANTSGSTASAATNMPQVDVEQVLNSMAQNTPEKLNWRTSIVDLMKLVGMDSSLAARKTLAQELHYTGDMNDSAPMNIWLHKQVMQKIAQNGGKLPADLANA